MVPDTLMERPLWIGSVDEQITQGHEEEQAKRETDLGQRNDRAGHGIGQANVRCNQADNRLRIVDVSHDCAAAECK